MNRADRIKRGCTEKVQFAKEWQAKREAQRSALRHYQCRYCRKFHVGHPS